MEDLGLGFLQLSRPANTLSGGEAQRLRLVVEHHLDVIAASDWLIELGPGGGKQAAMILKRGAMLPRRAFETAGADVQATDSPRLVLSCA